MIYSIAEAITWMCSMNKLFYKFWNQSLREKRPNTELFLVVFFRIWPEYGEMRSISPYLVRMREKTDQK